MLIVIDIGNTNSVFACYENDKHLATWRCETKHSRTA
nr:type III pantothenate kinase [Pseudomonadota bacterium]